MRVGTKVIRYRKNQVIFCRGDHSGSIFYVEHGNVKLTVTSDEGDEALIAIQSSGTFIGENGIAMEPLRRSNTAIALTDSRLIRIERNAMRLLLRAEPDVSDAVLSGLIEQNIQMQERMTGNLLYSSERQLAQALLMLARLREHAPDGQIPRVSQQDLANMVGITRQRINVLLKGFRKSGFIDSVGLKINPSILTVLPGASP